MSYRWAVLSCCVWSIIASLAVADESPTAGPDLTASTRVARKAEQKLLQSMQMKIKAQWADVTPREVLTSLTKQSEIGLWIDTEALAAVGYSTDHKITLNLGEVTVETALYFLLTPLSLDWQGQTGVLEVSTRERIKETLFTRIYDVSALSKVLEPQLEAVNWQPSVPAGILGGGMGGGGMVGGGVMFSVANDDDTAEPSLLAQFGGMGGGGLGAHPPVSPVSKGWTIAPRILRAETALIESIQSSCAVGWQATEGEGGDISALPGRLIVRQNYRGQSQVQSLLQALESLLVHGVKSKSISVQRAGYPATEDAAIVKALAEPIAMDHEHLPLDKILQAIAKSVGVRILLDLPAFADEDIAANQQVSIHYKSIALNVVLKHLLEPLRLTYLVHEGTLIVTTQAKAAEELEVLIYNSADISGNAKELVPIIEKSTPGTWMSIDGDGGTVTPLGASLLVIRQTQRCHVEISSLLNELREKADPPRASEPPPLVQRIYVVQDQTAKQDLMLSLPEMVTGWDSQRGSVLQLGHCLAIKQPAQVQDRIGEIIGALNTANGFLTPKPSAGNAPTKTAASPSIGAPPAAPVKLAPTP
ncbi:MAG: outer rane porin HofQ [Schlesneria sp.]|nr:outer rane porin HofQ [Schlesneria sp.]